MKHHDETPENYDPRAGNIIKEGDYFKVTNDVDKAPLADYTMHGYTSKWDFYEAVRAVVERWRGRIGECVQERHGFRKLRFHDTPGGRPDEEWIADYLLEPTARPDYMNKPEKDPIAEEVDKAFGFGW